MKMRLIPAAALLAVLTLVATAPAADAQTFARMHTGHGDILLLLEPDDAPHHVANFVHLSRSGFYDGTTFHRVVPGFMIQGGDPLSRDASRRNDGTGYPMLADVLTEEERPWLGKIEEALAARGYAPLQVPVNLKAEFSRARHVRGTLSMGRAQGPDTAGSQFFICVAAASNLNVKYSAFGHVVHGMDVVDAIVNVPRDPRDNPVDPVVVERIDILEGLDGLDEDELAAWEQDDRASVIEP